MDPNVALNILATLLEAFSALLGIIIALVFFLAQRETQLIPEQFDRTKYDLTIELTDDDGNLKIPESRIDQLRLGTRGVWDFSSMYTIILDDLSERFAPGEKVPRDELFPEALERLKVLAELYQNPMLVVRTEIGRFAGFFIPCISLLVYCLLILPIVTIIPLNVPFNGFPIWIAVGLAILTIAMLIRILF